MPQGLETSFWVILSDFSTLLQERKKTQECNQAQRKVNVSRQVSEWARGQKQVSKSESGHT